MTGRRHGPGVGPDLKLIPLPDARPQGFLTEGTVPVASADRALEVLFTDRRVPNRAVVEGRRALPSFPLDPDEAARVTRWDAGHIELEVNAIHPRPLVVAQRWYPGWHARIGGRPVQVARANYQLMAVAVPAGRATVELRFTPVSVRWGAGVSVVAGLFSGAWLAVLLWRRGRHPGGRTGIAGKARHRAEP